MAQTWRDLLFAHWPVPPEEVRPLVPASLPLDIRDGKAWVGVVPFRMTGIRLRGLPPVPGLSAFPELNVRTYVTGGGKPGVYFFSLDGGSRIAVEVARHFFHLPYVRARLSCLTDGDAIRYSSLRTDRRLPPAELRVAYRPMGPPAHPQAGSLERWLTERYCLYTVDAKNRVLRGDLHHEPWPLQPAAAEIAANTMAAAAGIALPAEPPLLHFARRLDAVLWALRPA
jgi:uncharacterized protein YqjF (DUF2071 family)